MVKPLSFKGDKKPKKRKRQDAADDDTNRANRGRSLQESSSKAPAEDDDSGSHEEQSWVTADVTTDISGPVVIVLPSTPPTCVACDANGKVFALAVENMVEGDPRTAEPHDVRQVWVATKVAGSEGFNFKGHHGRYLSCDKFGILSANSAAVSPYETFIPIETPNTPGTFSFQVRGGDAEAFLSIKERDTTATSSAADVEIRGDATSISFPTTFRVRMQARFKPRLKASKESKALEKISRQELETVVGRKLEDHEVKRLRRARKEGSYHEEILNVRVKGKHDKFAS